MARTKQTAMGHGRKHWGEYWDTGLEDPYKLESVGRTTLGPRGSVGCGLDMLGADDLEDEVGTVQHDPFDNAHAYKMGDVVTYWGQYWKATRDISPPWFPSLQSGEVPGSSSAWASLNAQEVVQSVIGMLVGDDIVTIPKAGDDYTDAKTVTAVQNALVHGHSYDLGSTGPNNDGVDGIFGSKTKAAIKQLQATIGESQTGKIDEGVIMALKVTPGVLPPGVTMAGRAAVQAQVALDAATAAEHAATPADVQAAAQQAQAAASAAAPPPPPAVQQKMAQAAAQAKSAKTPAEIKTAAQAVASAAQDVNVAVRPPWYELPVWSGGPPRWQAGAVAGGAAVGLTAIVAALVKR